MAGRRRSCQRAFALEDCILPLLPFHGPQQATQPYFISSGYESAVLQVLGMRTAKIIVDSRNNDHKFMTDLSM